MQNFTKNKKIFFKLFVTVFLFSIFLGNFKAVESLFRPNAVIKNLFFETSGLTVSPTPKAINKTENLSNNISFTPGVYSDEPQVKEVVEESWDWQTQGEVYFFENLIQIGGEKSSNLWNENYIFQTISNSSQFKNLIFEYKLETVENLVGFDELAFGVMINDKFLYHIGVENLGGWSRMILDLSDFNQDFLEIKFLAGNSGDNLKSTWVKLRNIKVY